VTASFAAAAFADIRVEFFIQNRILTAALSAFWIVVIINAFNFPVWGFAEKAAAEYGLARDAAPGSALFDLKLGFLYLQEGRYADAAREFEAAAKDDPGLFDAFFYLGLTFSKQDKVEPAVEAFKRALEIEPGRELAALGLAEVLVGEKRLDDAVDAMTRSPSQLGCYPQVAVWFAPVEGDSVAPR